MFKRLARLVLDLVAVFRGRAHIVYPHDTPAAKNLHDTAQPIIRKI
jgi:hypothetical protein